MVSGQAHLGSLLADFAGLRGIEAYAIEAAGASGAAALRAGYLAVKSGFVDVALVVGVEKVTDKIPEEVDAALTATLDSDYEAVQGLTLTAQAALLMQRYLYEYRVARQDFAAFSVLAHQNGVANPHAMFRKAIRPEIYTRAGLVCDPLNLFDVAPDADGAAAVVLTRAAHLPQLHSGQPVRIASSSVATDTVGLHDRPNPLDFRAARLSVEKAILQAGIGLEQIDFFEPSDFSSITAALSLEAAGFVRPGQGTQFVQNGKSRIPMLTMGGLKARGNPWGATGVYQVVESVLQLRGQAGENQVVDARLGMVQSLGGAAATAITHILEKVS